MTLTVNDHTASGCPLVALCRVVLVLVSGLVRGLAKKVGVGMSHLTSVGHLLRGEETFPRANPVEVEGWKTTRLSIWWLMRARR